VDEIVAPQDVLLTAEQASAAWEEEKAARLSGPAEAAPEKTELAETTKTEAAVEAPAKPAVDPIEARFAALEAEITKAKTDLGRANGRIAAMQSAAATSAQAAAKSAGDAAPTQAQIDAAVEDPEEWKRLMEDFPDWGVAFEKKMDAKIAAAMRAQPAKAEAAPAPDISTAVQLEVQKREIARVDRKHPTWREMVKSSEFQEWKAAQAPEIQALENSDSADDAIEMLNLFEGSKATNRTADITARRKGNLEVAAVQGKPRQQSSAVKPAGELSPRELWELEKKQRQQRREAA